MNDIAIDLSTFGYSNYILTKSGKLFKIKPALKEIKKDNINRFYIIADNGKTKKIPLKELYRKAFKEEFAIDNIKNLNHEEWKQIPETNGKYFISNCGRVKSLCGYTVKILKYYK